MPSASSCGHARNADRRIFDRSARTPVKHLFRETPHPNFRFRKSAPISWHIEPILAKRNLISRLTPISQDSMGGALRIRARDGLGVAWLLHSLVEPDVDAKQLA